LDEAIQTYERVLSALSPDSTPRLCALLRGDKAIALMQIASQEDDVSAAKSALAELSVVVQALRDGDDEFLLQRYNVELREAKAFVERARGP
jgi:hypothetical protein